VSSGGIFFGEFLEMSPQQVRGFAFGVTAVVCGIILLIPLSHDVETDEEFYEEEHPKIKDDASIQRGLDQARQMHEDGYLTHAEFRRIERRLLKEQSGDSESQQEGEEEERSDWEARPLIQGTGDPLSMHRQGSSGGLWRSIDAWLDVPVSTCHLPQSPDALEGEV